MMHITSSVWCGVDDYDRLVGVPGVTFKTFSPFSHYLVPGLVEAEGAI
jgi:hypothetical protein